MMPDIRLLTSCDTPSACTHWRAGPDRRKRWINFTPFRGRNSPRHSIPWIRISWSAPRTRGRPAQEHWKNGWIRCRSAHPSGCGSAAHGYAHGECRRVSARPSLLRRTHETKNSRKSCRCCATTVSTSCIQSAKKTLPGEDALGAVDPYVPAEDRHVRRRSPGQPVGGVLPPLRDALYVRQAEQVRAYGVSYDSDRPGGLVIGESFDLAAELAEDPEWFTWVDGQREVELPGGLLWTGEGDQGAQGCFARLAEDGTLVRAVFLTESQPFTEPRPRTGHSRRRVGHLAESGEASPAVGRRPPGTGGGRGTAAPHAAAGGRGIAAGAASGTIAARSAVPTTIRSGSARQNRRVPRTIGAKRPAAPGGPVRHGLVGRGGAGHPASARGARGVRGRAYGNHGNRPHQDRRRNGAHR